MYTSGFSDSASSSNQMVKLTMVELNSEIEEEPLSSLTEEALSKYDIEIGANWDRDRSPKSSPTFITNELIERWNDESKKWMSEQNYNASFPDDFTSLDVFGPKIVDDYDYINVCKRRKTGENQDAKPIIATQKLSLPVVSPKKFQINNNNQNLKKSFKLKDKPQTLLKKTLIYAASQHVKENQSIYSILDSNL